MMRKRRSNSTCPTERWSFRRTTFILGLIAIAIVRDCRGDYLMGGHLDNNENPEAPKIERRIDVATSEESKISPRTSSSSFDDPDRDFDLGLDLLAEPSSVNPSRILNSDISAEDEDPEKTDIAPRYRIPLVPYAFNGGQPFSLEKDPITGQIDFEKAPPLKALDYSTKSTENTSTDDFNDGDDDKSLENKSKINLKKQTDENVGPNEINPYSPSFHDFLNLPIRYTNEKYENSEKYPLISNSYANTKVQSGANSYNTHNHKKYHESVKSSVNAYLQPSRKTHIQSVTKPTMKKSTIEPRETTTTSTTPKTTTTQKTTTTTTTTTIKTTTKAAVKTTIPIAKTAKPELPKITTWKPPKIVSHSEEYSEDDYEATLPIERLHPISGTSQKSTQSPPRYVPPPARPTKPSKIHSTNEETNDDYEESYDYYDRIYHVDDKPTNSKENDTDADYSYGLNLFGVGSRDSVKPLQSTTLKMSSSTISTTVSPNPITTANSMDLESDDKESDQTENPTTTTTTTTTRMATEEKPVTSLALDINNSYKPNYPNNLQIPSTIDNTISSVIGNNVYHRPRPTNYENYYPRPPIMKPAPGVIVKNPNVVVPPGHNTVSFVLGNRQTIGSNVEPIGEYYSNVHSGLPIDRTGISYGNVANSRPLNNQDNYPGQMILSAGIGVAPNNLGPFHKLPQSTDNNSFDRGLVSVSDGLPNFDGSNPVGAQSIANNNAESSTWQPQDSEAPKWRTSTISPTSEQQQNLQQQQNQSNHNNQFDYHVVFPDEKIDKPSETSKIDDSSIKTDDRVIVVHETQINSGNPLQHESPSQPGSTGDSEIGFNHDSTTQRFNGKPDDRVFPELSESLTPPMETPNRIQQQIHRPPNYNYYHHQHSIGNSRPNDYSRPQRLPLPPLPPSSSSSSGSSSNGFKRRPTASLDTNLPNILPQFRPNAKVSQGHNRGDNIGTIPAGHYPNSMIRRQPLPHHHHHHHHHANRPSRRPAVPSHLQRLNPPPLPPLSPPITSLRLPTPAALIAPNPANAPHHEIPPQDMEPRPILQKRLHQGPVGVPPILNIDERHPIVNFANQQSQSSKLRLDDDDVERFSAEPPQQPPRVPFFGKRATPTGSDAIVDGIPQVATLQMIQQHGGDDNIVKAKLTPIYKLNTNNLTNNPHGDDEHAQQNGGEDKNSETDGNRRGDHGFKTIGEVLPADVEHERSDYADTGDSPVYLVYPVKGGSDVDPTINDDDDDSNDATVVLGKYGSQRPLTPDTLSKLNDEATSTDNANQGYRPPVGPFTVSSSPQLASDFPYPLERSDPSMFTEPLREKPLLVPSEQRKTNQDEKKSDNVVNDDNANRDNDASVNVIPYPQDHIPFGLTEHSGPISATLHRFDGSSSIVDSSSTPIAYVYTPTVRTIAKRPEDAYGHANFEKTQVLLQSQRPTSTSSGPAAPLSFMAPFVASANAEATSTNGWNVVKLDKSETSESTIVHRRNDGDSKMDDDENAKKNDEEKNNNNNNSNHKNNDSDKDKDIDKDEVAKEEKKNETKKDVGEVSEATKHEEEKEKDKVKNENSFNVENFTPQLFGGFKPIYEFPSDSDTDPTLGDKVSGGAPAIERPRSGTEPAKMEARKLDDV